MMKMLKQGHDMYKVHHYISSHFPSYFSGQGHEMMLAYYGSEHLEYQQCQRKVMFSA